MHVAPSEGTPRNVAEPVEVVDDEIRQLVDDMFETMYDAPGIGLAAIQVGEPIRMLVMDISKEDEDRKPHVLINPEVVATGDEPSTYEEGCLSIPGFLGEVERPESVTVKGFTRQGQPTRIKAKGWLARIFQHEIDHLDGVLFIDRAESVWKLEEEQEQPMQVLPLE